MRKRSSFFLCLIILLAAGGFVFYTGWSQFKVPQGAVGILVSKTGGINPNPITHEKFSWAWEFLLPTNARVVLFTPRPYSFQKSSSGILPSGNEYKRVYNGAADFSYAFDFSIELKSSIQQISFLLKNQEIQSAEDLQSLLDRSSSLICSAVAQELLDGLLSGKVTNSKEAQEKALLCAKEAASSYKEKFSMESISVTRFNVPDIALYKSAAASYGEYAASLREAAAASAQKEVEENSRFKTTIQKMEALGEMLKKYPELSDLLKNSDNINKTIETINSIN